MKPKVLVIGIDGGTFDIINPLINKGSLPNLKRLIENGSSGILQSTIPPVSPAAWSTFITGQNPGSHGIYNFFDIWPNTYKLRILNASMRKGKSFWKYAEEAGKRVCLINVPFTFPPEKVNGVVIAGMDTPSYDSDFMYPKELKDEIERHVGKYRVDTHISDIQGYESMEEHKLLDIFKKHVFEQIDIHARTALYLIKKEEWDIFTVVFTSTDRAQHHYWKFYKNGKDALSKVIPHVYEKIDGYIGEITKASGPGTNVVIMSDHGGGPIERVVVLNNWLSERGYLTTQTTSINHNLKIGIYRMVKKLFPKNIKKKLKKAFPEMKSKLSSFLILSGINWGATKAVAEGFYGSIYINTIGERPLGIVNAEDYDSVCDKIINELKGLVDPKTGASPIRDIYKKKNIYFGSSINSAPDIIIQPASGYQFVGDFVKLQHSGSLKGQEVFVDTIKTRVSGTHTPEGILIMHGDSIKKREKTVGAEIGDLPVTILGLLGIPIPGNMSGRFLKDILNTPSEVKYTADKEVNKKAADLQDMRVYTKEEEEAITKQLRNLGYID